MKSNYLNLAHLYVGEGDIPKALEILEEGLKEVADSKPKYRDILHSIQNLAARFYKLFLFTSI